MNELETRELSRITKELEHAHSHEARESLMRQYETLMRAYEARRRAEQVWYTHPTTTPGIWPDPYQPTWPVQPTSPWQPTIFCGDQVTGGKAGA